MFTTQAHEPGMQSLVPAQGSHTRRMVFTNNCPTASLWETVSAVKRKKTSVRSMNSTSGRGSGSATAAMVSNTIPCRHLQGLVHCHTATHCLLQRRRTATRSPTHAVSKNARQPLPHRQQRQLAKRLRTSAADFATCCAAAVGGKA